MVDYATGTPYWYDTRSLRRSDTKPEEGVIVSPIPREIETIPCPPTFSACNMVSLAHRRPVAQQLGGGGARARAAAAPRRADLR